MPVCDSHTALESSINRIHGSIAQLYDIDRKRADDFSEMKVSVARIEEQTHAGFARLEQWQEEFQSHAQSRDERIEKALAQITTNQKKRKWSPQTIVALVSSILGPAGISAIFLAIRSAK